MIMRLHKKRISKKLETQKKQIEAIKKYFLHEVKQKRTFLKRNLVFAKFDISEKEGWNKFAIGSIKNHRTKKISINRVRRLHWIPTLIDFIKKNNYISPNPDIRYLVINKKRKIIVDSESYLIVMKIISDSMIMVITAYPKNK